MQSRSCRFQLLVVMFVGLALVSWGGARPATADTFDLSAILTSDSGTMDNADLSFLDDMQAAAAPAEPAAAGKACKTNAQCKKTEWCSKDNGACKSEGKCTMRPDACPEVVDPVCGCNKRTYNNECRAHKAGVNVNHKGKCGKKGK